MGLHLPLQLKDNVSTDIEQNIPRYTVFRVTVYYRREFRYIAHLYTVALFRHSE